MDQKNSAFDYLMYAYLFVCIFSSHNWFTYPALTQGEIFRFEKIFLFGKIEIYHLFSIGLLAIILFARFGPNRSHDAWGEKNYLKTLFWIYFIPLNLLIYYTIWIKKIPLSEFGLRSVAKFFVYLVAVLYIQDIFFKKKSSRDLARIMTILEVFILIRCSYSILKYLMGFGQYINELGRIRVGQENDFADFYILLFIIALTRLFFNRDEGKNMRLMHVMGIAATSFVVIFSFRRYLWIEFIVAFGLILLFHAQINRIHTYKVITSFCFGSAILLSVVLVLSPAKFVNNMYVGRLLSTLSLIDVKYESEYGTQMGHVHEINEGWYNVKKNWVLGVTPYGRDLIQRFKTRSWQRGLYVHNAFLGSWLVYGLLGLALFLFLYLKSMQLGFQMFFKSGNVLGLILLVFLVCQTFKNLIWQTAITFENVTIVYIFLISLVLRARKLGAETKNATAVQPAG
jgi:hypothetical protein